MSHHKQNIPSPSHPYSIRRTTTPIRLMLSPTMTDRSDSDIISSSPIKLELDSLRDRFRSQYDDLDITDTSTWVVLWIGNHLVSMEWTSGRPLFCSQNNVYRPQVLHTRSAHEPVISSSSSCSSIPQWWWISLRANQIKSGVCSNRLSSYLQNSPNMHLMSPSGLQSLPSLPNQQLRLTDRIFTSANSNRFPQMALGPCISLPFGNTQQVLHLIQYKPIHGSGCILQPDIFLAPTNTNMY